MIKNLNLFHRIRRIVLISKHTNSPPVKVAIYGAMAHFQTEFVAFI